MSHLSSSYINWQRHLHRKQIDLIKFEDSYNFLKEHGVENDDKCTLKELKKIVNSKNPHWEWKKKNGNGKD